MGDAVEMLGYGLLAYVAVKAVLAWYVEHDLNRSFRARAQREARGPLRDGAAIMPGTDGV